ncbi:MAG: hypothetical protein ACSHX0_03640 [Akkermansiaceae bacterium]
MRISLLIVIPLCLMTLLGTWLLGTRGIKFTTAPSPERISQVTAAWQDDQAHAITSQSGISAANQTSLPLAKTLLSNTEAAAAQTSPPPIPTGDLTAAPKLSQYATHASAGSLAFIQLAQHLETVASPQHARLAWERVIDMTRPDSSERASALSAIQRLKSTQQPWPQSTENQITLILHAGTNSQETSILQTALGSVANKINLYSDHIVNISVQITLGNDATEQTALTPIAMWFSSNSTPPSETDPISVITDTTNAEILTPDIERGIYRLIQSRLSNKTSFSPLPEIPENTVHDNALELHVTRLMWREFALSIP